MFIPTSALLGMHSIYIGQLLQPAAAPLILRMHVYIGRVTITKYYLYRAISSIQVIIIYDITRFWS